MTNNIDLKYIYILARFIHIGTTVAEYFQLDGMEIPYRHHYVSVF